MTDHLKNVAKFCFEGSGKSRQNVMIVPVVGGEQEKIVLVKETLVKNLFSCRHVSAKATSFAESISRRCCCNTRCEHVIIFFFLEFV